MTSLKDQLIEKLHEKKRIREAAQKRVTDLAVAFAANILFDSLDSEENTQRHVFFTDKTALSLRIEDRPLTVQTEGLGSPRDGSRLFLHQIAVYLSENNLNGCLKSEKQGDQELYCFSVDKKLLLELLGV